MSLEDAIRRDDHNLLERWLKGICIAEYKNEKGESLLHLAAKSGNFCLTKYFIQAGCDVNSKNNSNKVPIEVALDRTPHWRRCSAVVKLLIEAGAHMNAVNSWGKSLLMTCFYHDYDWNDDLDTANLLLDNGANIQSENQFNDTPLHIAAEFCKPESVNLLLARGADPNMKNNLTKTPLHYASMLKTDIHDDHDGNSALKYFKHKQYKTLKILLEHGADVNIRNDEDKSPFHIILQFGDLEAVQLFLQHGADFNEKDFRGNIAARCAAKNKDVRVLNLLVNLKNINLEERSGYGVTAMHNAVKYGLLDNIKVLYEKGVNINCHVDGHTLLYNVIQSFNAFADLDREKLMDFLIDLGADINGKGYHGEMIIELPELKFIKGKGYLIKFVLSFFAKHALFGNKVCDKQLDVIKGKQFFKIYFDECIRELSEFEKLIFNDKARIIPIFLGDREVIARYALNKELLRKYYKIEFSLKFTIYGEFIEEMFVHERNKRIIKDHAFEVIGNALPRQIQTSIIVKKIIDSLSIEDLVKSMRNYEYYFTSSFKDLHVPDEYDTLYGM